MISINATMLLTILNFILLVILLRAILFKPLLKYLDERAKTIAESLRLADENKKRSQEIAIEEERIIREARAKANEIVDRAISTASDESRELIRDAREKAQAIVDATRSELTEEADRIKRELRKDVLSMAISLSEKVLDREIREDDHRDLLEKSFKNLGV